MHSSHYTLLRCVIRDFPEKYGLGERTNMSPFICSFAVFTHIFHPLYGGTPYNNKLCVRHEAAEKSEVLST